MTSFVELNPATGVVTVTADGPTAFVANPATGIVTGAPDNPTQFIELNPATGIVTAVTSAMQVKAQAILASITAATPRTNYAGTATWDNAGAYANSLVQTANGWNNPQVLLSDASKFRISGAPAVVSGDVNATTKDQSTQWGAPAPALSDGGCGFGVGFNYNKQTFDIGLQGDAGLIECRVRINGQYIPTIIRAAGGFSYHRLNMGSAAQRTIELFFNGPGGTTGGMNFETGATVTPLSALPFSATMIGDSIVAGATTTTLYTDLMLSTPQMTAEMLGLPFLEVRGISGQGYVTTVNSQTIGQRAAADAVRKAQPDIIFMSGSANDAAVDSSGALAAAVTAVLAAAPNAFVVATSCFRQPSNDLGATRNAANLAALRALSNPRLCVRDGFLDIVPGGNSSTYIDGGTNHPNAAGTTHMAYDCYKPDLVSFLTAYR